MLWPNRFISSLITALIVHMSFLHMAWANPDPPKFTIRFSHVVKENTPKGLAAAHFAKLVNQRAKGRLTVEVYPNSSLYKDREEMEALQLGAVEMLAPSLAKFGQLSIRDFEVFDLPYIFPDKNAARIITQGPIGKSLFSQLEPRGIRGLAYWDNGFKIMSSNSPLRLPTDLKGKKMRIQPSKVIHEQMTTLDATPIPLPFSDAFNALKTGVVDGTENPPSNLFSQNMHAVQRYVAVTNHGYLGYAVIINKKFWDSLPNDLKQIIERSLQEATILNNTHSESLNKQALDDIQKSGLSVVHYPTEAELDAWRKALSPVHSAMEGRIDKDLIATIKRAVQVK